MKINSIYKKFIKVIFVLLFYATNLIALENKIIVKVNNEIITSVDIENEINYLTILNPQVKNLEKKRLTNIAKNSLIREKVKIISLLDLVEKISVEDEYVDKIIKTTYKKNGFN